MTCLLDLDYDGRKQFVWDRLRTVPEWEDVCSINDFSMEQNKDGLTNIIYRVYKNNNPNDYPILFRIYGSNKYLNRAKKLEFLSILSKRHYGVKLIQHFPEGRLEEWRVGFKSLNDYGCRDPLLSRQIAEKLADLHNIPIEDPTFCSFTDMLRSWISLCEKYSSVNSFPGFSLRNLSQEIALNEELIRNECCDFVYGHQDLLRGNVLRNESGDILLVDFEYCCILPAPLDICHHYCEWMTRYDSESYWIDWRLHPNEDEERNFISAYLHRRHGREPEEKDISDMLSSVHRLQCFSFFFWFVWAVMQTLIGVDWNSHDYAVNRWHLYQELKLKYFGIEALSVICE